jgi:hypothetical protein
VLAKQCVYVANATARECSNADGSAPDVRVVSGIDLPTVAGLAIQHHLLRVHATRARLVLTQR